MPTKKTTAKKTATKKVAKKSSPKKVTKATKKAATKKTASKASNKKTATKKAAPKAELVVALPEQAFWVSNGAVLHDLLDLADYLATIEEEVFNHHVSSDKHDFAEWVEYVLNDIECAAALRQARVPKRAQTVVVTHLKRYSI